MGFRHDGALPCPPPLKLELAGGDGGLVYDGGLGLSLVSHGGEGSPRCGRRERAGRRGPGGGACELERVAVLGSSGGGDGESGGIKGSG